ncbi:MAG TPA: hypothetical protein DCQ50_20905 [Chryseobacterium sp.]|nr:hypothetical protein [Chryseobacterium sp.]
MKKYFPILLSKAGELTALSKLSEPVKNQLTPIIQVLPDSLESIITFASNWDFEGNEIFLDFSLFGNNNLPLRRFISDLVNLNVNIVPVINHNANPEYIDLLERLFLDGEIEKVSFRFSNSIGGFINFNRMLAEMLNYLNISESQVSILLDFGLVDENNYNNSAALAINIIQSIPNSEDFDNIVVASGSFLENLGSLNPPDRVYRLQRYEWNIWNLIITQIQQNNIKYSDYGIKYPYYTEANFQGSCSIKYTVESEYVIYRGEVSSNHRDGNGQYITFSGRLINSNDYMGENFSWGDEKINFYASQDLRDPKKKTGNATSWVEISQNHHLTLIHSLL